MSPNIKMIMIIYAHTLAWPFHKIIILQVEIERYGGKMSFHTHKNLGKTIYLFFQIKVEQFNISTSGI